MPHKMIARAQCDKCNFEAYCVKFWYWKMPVLRNHMNGLAETPKCFEFKNTFNKSIQS